MTKPLSLDLFSGGGGACIGIQQAGFEVVGVDIKPHPNYPGHFIQGDIHDLPVDVMDFDFVWASPPCQSHSIATYSMGKAYKDSLPNLVPITREILHNHPYTVIENVCQAQIRHDVVLTGKMMGLPYLQRKRAFETTFFVMTPPLQNVDRTDWDNGKAITVWKGMSGTNKSQRERRKRLGLPSRPSREYVKEVMGIPQHYEMTYAELGESIPPAYSEYIAREALRQMNL